MASVQVLILQSGRSDVYGLPLTPGSIVTVDRDYAVSLISTGFASWMNPADAYDGETNLRKPSETYALCQPSVPFWIPPGDGGSNGLSFSGTRGVFSLSAAVATNFWVFFTYGGYIYLPAGAGGLASAGWRWCRMTSDTSGEVFGDTYSGFGQPVFVSSPATLPNCNAGRVTQTLLEVQTVSFTTPGRALGPNGRMEWGFRLAGNSSAGVKQYRVRWNSQAMISLQTSTNPAVEMAGYIQNAGVETAQIIPRSSSLTGIGGTGSVVAFNEVMNIDTRSDITVTESLQLAANTDSICRVYSSFSARYGA